MGSEDAADPVCVHVTEHVHQIRWEAVVTIDGTHRPWGDGVVSLGAIIVGDVNLLFAVVCVLHEECVRQEGVSYGALGEEPVLRGVHV